jgi:hypothetical protein
MDGPVVASLISSSVAVLVAVGSAVRSDLQRAGDRRYERRRMFLIDAQEAALALRDALRNYGDVLQHIASNPPFAGGTDEQRRAVAVAVGRLDIASSRIDDAAVVEALAHWEQLARETLIAVEQNAAPNEEAAFTEVNRLVSQALRSARGLERR